MSSTKFRHGASIALIFFAQITYTMAQKKQWHKLSNPEKCWVMWHPFVAYKTFKTTEFVIKIVNDKSIIAELDSFSNGGKLDAFRHIFWMACVTKKIGEKKALKLGYAHEKGNYIQFKKGKLEDGNLPDYASSKMDSLNNIIGAKIGSNWRTEKKSIDKNEIITTIKNGNAYIVLRNKNGNFIDCNNHEIVFPNKQWKNNKCLLLLSELKR